MCNSDSPVQSGLVRALRGSALGRFGQSSQGITAVEFALTFPLFMLFIMATLEVGRSLEARNEISHALSRAVRVINLDDSQTPSNVASLMATYLDDFDAEELTITTVSTEVAGTEYIDISVSFPFDLTIPFATLTSVTLHVDTRMPLISASR